MMVKNVPYKPPSPDLVKKRHAWAMHYMSKGAARKRAEFKACQKTERSPYPPVDLELERPNRRQRPDGSYND